MIAGRVFSRYSAVTEPLVLSGKLQQNLVADKGRTAFPGIFLLQVCVIFAFGTANDGRGHLLARHAPAIAAFRPLFPSPLAIRFDRFDKVTHEGFNSSHCQQMVKTTIGGKDGHPFGFLPVKEISAFLDASRFIMVLCRKFPSGFNPKPQ